MGRFPQVPTVGLVVAVFLAVPLAAGARSEDHAVPQRPATDVGGPVAPGTVWNLAGSPYKVVSDVEVPVSVTLTIEAGVEIRMGKARSVHVAGNVEARGTEPQPIVVTADFTAEPWNSWVLGEGSGPSHFEYVNFSYNGARRTAMLEIHTDRVVVSRCRF